MAPCIPQYLMLSLWMVFNMMQCFAVTEGDVQDLRGEVGGNITIHCPYDTRKTIKFFYFQKPDKTVVNGYHVEKKNNDGKKFPTWENTRVENKTTVHMTNLNISHKGEYDCFIMYSDSTDRPSKTRVRLSVTANYSKPEVSVKCNDGLSCMVTCASHGGYPGTEMKWSVPGSPIWKVVNNSKTPSPVTKLVNSSSTAYFNCSQGELKYLSCHVGEVTSEMFSVCAPEDPAPGQYEHFLIPVAICGVVTFTVLSGVLVWWKCIKRRIRAVAVNGRQVNGSKDEVIQLNQNQEEEKTP